MENNELKEVSTKNCTCHYFYDKIKTEDIDFDDILSSKKSCTNVLICNISYKTVLIGAKPLRTRFDNIDGFIRVYDWTRYLLLFGPEKYDPIYIRIRYLISQKSGIACYFS